MDSLKISRHPSLPYLVLLGTGLLGHGMLLLTDGSYVDGWFLEYLIRLEKWDVVRDFWVLHGYPVHFWLQRWIGHASVFTLRTISFACILLIALFQYKILIRFTPLTEKQSLFLAAFALLWPFYHLLVWSVFAPGMIFPVLFHAGWYNYLCLKEKKRHPILFLPSVLAIFLSFNYPVYLTYHLAFLLLYSLGSAEWRPHLQLKSLTKQFLTFLKRNWIMTLLPFAFFVLKNIFYPVSIPYNNIRLLSLTTLESILKNILRNITEPVLSIVYSLPTFWFVLVPGIIVSSLLAVKFLKTSESISKQMISGIILVGSILIITLSITYGLVWKTVKLMSVKSRYAFVANLGYGLLLLGGLHWFFNKYWNEKRTLIQPILTIILVAMILVDINLYSMWQARWARTASIIHNLKTKTPIPNASIYFLKDNFPLGVDTREYADDFTLMLLEAWNQKKQIGITSHYQGKRSRREAAQKIIKEWEERSLRYHMLVNEFDPKGCFAEVIVSPKIYHQPILIGFRYLYYRLINPKLMDQFLEDLTYVELNPLRINTQNEACS